MPYIQFTIAGGMGCVPADCSLAKFTLLPSSSASFVGLTSIIIELLSSDGWFVSWIASGAFFWDRGQKTSCFYSGSASSTCNSNLHFPHPALSASMRVGSFPFAWFCWVLTGSTVASDVSLMVDYSSKVASLTIEPSTKRTLLMIEYSFGFFWVASTD